MPKDDKDIPIPRALGRFLGHLWNAAAKPVPPDKDVVSERTEEQPAEIDGKKVILRRTTIEEVEFRQE